ncbi:uncharacterized protein LY89DRAFT_318777 [Mollisia scopiformis]|uniref:Secreted protein n=1 Tax=Mollisia scopiformis TaxID=149040 RepID=A0A132BBN1_MOLSC|nr:uncharacterized protein LY89DRAFT_318777 [Mollisia scopiformis]KUJ09057.1 hypothetical protein LY89DRAFT_318777 [Mollisia scopiformis]
MTSAHTHSLQLALSLLSLSISHWRTATAMGGICNAGNGYRADTLPLDMSHTRIQRADCTPRFTGNISEQYKVIFLLSSIAAEYGKYVAQISWLILFPACVRYLFLVFVQISSHLMWNTSSTRLVHCTEETQRLHNQRDSPAQQHTLGQLR